MPLIGVMALAMLADVAFMPQGAPVIVLGDNWLAGEWLALGVVLLPAQLLARWIEGDMALAARATLEVVLYVAGMAVLLPAFIVSLTGSFAIVELASLAAAGQVLWLAALPGLAAVQEFVRSGRGMPFPLDPPRQLVTRGPYAYVRNPMQISGVLLLLVAGIALGSAWVALGALVSLVCGSGFASWSEGAISRSASGRDGSRIAAPCELSSDCGRGSSTSSLLRVTRHAT